MPLLRHTAGSLILAGALAACAAAGAPASPTTSAPTTAAPEPAFGTPSGNFSVAATVETDPVPSKGDAADDPAIWINVADPGRSLIIGTDKQEDGGLAVYDLAGSEVAFYADGAMNNVDVRGDIVVAGNETNNSIAIYRVRGGGLVPAASRTIEPGIEIYGNCLYLSQATGDLHVFLTSKEGNIEQWELFDAGDGELDGRLVRSLELDSQTEGCVADDDLGVVYFAEEAVGIWRFGAEPEAGDRGELIDTIDGGGQLTADVEGLAIATLPDGEGFLFASSQGNHEYVIYSRTDNDYLATFSIEDAGGIDGTSDTDGIDVTTTSLGGAFPSGVFIAQDGKNSGGAQNFKLVPLDTILPSSRHRSRGSHGPFRSQAPFRVAVLPTHDTRLLGERYAGERRPAGERWEPNRDM